MAKRRSKCQCQINRHDPNFYRTTCSASGVMKTCPCWNFFESPMTKVPSLVGWRESGKLQGSQKGSRHSQMPIRWVVKRLWHVLSWPAWTISGSGGTPQVGLIDKKPCSFLVQCIRSHMAHTAHSVPSCRIFTWVSGFSWIAHSCRHFLPSVCFWSTEHKPRKQTACISAKTKPKYKCPCVAEPTRLGWNWFPCCSLLPMRSPSSACSFWCVLLPMCSPSSSLSCQRVLLPLRSLSNADLVIFYRLGTKIRS